MRMIATTPLLLLLLLLQVQVRATTPGGARLQTIDLLRDGRWEEFASGVHKSEEDLDASGAWWADGARHFGQLQQKARGRGPPGGLRVQCSKASTTLFQFVDARSVPALTTLALESLELRVDGVDSAVQELPDPPPGAFAGILVHLELDTGAQTVLETAVPLAQSVRAPFSLEASVNTSSFAEGAASVTVGITCTGYSGDFGLAGIELVARARASESSQEPGAPITSNPSRASRHRFGPLQALLLPATVTLCSHASLDRMGVLAASLAQWQAVHAGHDGATVMASVALWRVWVDNRGVNVGENDDLQVVAQFEASLAREGVDLRTMKITVHVQAPKSAQEAYPINVLRNLAFSAVETEWVFFLDADLLPGGSFVRAMQEALAQKPVAKVTYVVPAFEENHLSQSLRACKQAAQADSRAKLRMLIRRGVIAPYKAVHQPRAHGATDVERWFRDGKEQLEGPYEIQPESQYEPYIVARVRDLVEASYGGDGGIESDKAEGHRLFDERFEGYGWNKVAMIADLVRSGFSFVVLRDTWVIHCAHEKSPWSRVFSTDPRARLRNRAVRFQRASAVAARRAAVCDV